MTDVYAVLSEDAVRNIKRPRWWKYGGPRQIWLNQKDLIGKLVDGLKPADLNELPVLQESMTIELIAAATPKDVINKRRRFYGGMTTPHVHFQGEVYILEEKDWYAFSSEIKEKFIDKLKNANTLSFDQVMALSETIAPMVNQNLG